MSRTAVIVSDAEDGSALCRLCMIYHQYFVNIFIPNNTYRICAEEAIHDLLSLKVAVGDGLPSNICHQCVKKLMEFRDFKEMCLKTAAELRKCYFDNLLKVCKTKDEDAADVETSREGSSQENIPMNDIQVTEVYITVPDEFAIGTVCQAKEESWSPENALVVKEEVNDGGSFTEGGAPVAALTSVAVDPLADDTMALKEEAQEPKGTGGKGNSLGDTSPHNHIQVTEVFVPVPDELAMGIVCHVEKDLRPTEFMDKEEIGDRLDCSENDVPVGSLSSVNVDPLAVDIATDKREVCPRDPLRKYDGFLEENIAETEGRKVPALCSVLKQFPAADQGEGNNDLVSTEWVGKGMSQSNQVGDEGDSSVTGCPALLPHPLAVMNMVDHCNYVEGTQAAREVHFNDNGSGVLEISQSQLRNNSSYYCMRDGNLQLKSSTDSSSGANLNPGNIVKKKKSIEPSDSNKMSSQLSDRAKSVTNNKCKPFWNQVANKCLPAEYICDYCGKRYSEIHLLALHMKEHVDRNESSIVLLEKEFPGGTPSNYLVMNGRNVESVMLETGGQSTTQANSKNKCENPTLKEFVDCEKNGREINHGNAFLVDTFTPSDKVGFVCDACGMAFQKKSDLVKHINIHVGLSAPKCRVCGKKFKLNSRLKKHEAIHTDVKQFKCDLHGNGCSKEFCRRKHKMAHTVLKPFECDICGKNFKYRYYLKNHSIVHTGEKPFECKCCGMRFNQRTNLRKHLSIHSSVKPWKCDVCGKMFTRKDNLKTHSAFHTGVMPFKCHLCGKNFTNKSSLNKHSVVHTGETPFKCNVCGKMFTQNADLARHLLIHTGEKQFKCHVCGKRFTVKSSLKRHIRIHTGEKPFKCNVCGRMFIESGSLATHMLTHTGVKPFRCYLCGKGFTVKSTLKGHLLIHTGVKPFKCSVCGKMFTRIGGLNTHSIVHTGLKPFNCDTCGKTFTQSRGLKNHLFIHTGEKPFKCEECGKNFSERRRLKEHLVNHTGVKPYKCDVCGKEYKCKSSIIGHLLTHANVKPSL